MLPITASTASAVPSSFDAFAVLRETVADMQARGRITRIAGVKPEMIRRAPGFDERRAGFRSFGAFVDAAAARGVVRIVTDADGWERVTADGEAEGGRETPNPDRLRPDIWRAFTEFGEGWLRCWDRATARAIRLPISPRPTEPASHTNLREALAGGTGAVILIESVPMDEQIQWMRDFASALGDHPLARPLMAALDDDKPFRAFSAVLNADTGLRRQFNRVKRDRVLDAVRRWAAANNVDLDALDHQAEPAEPGTARPSAGKQSDSGDALRAALHRAIDEMSLDDLRRLSVPAGYIVDAMR